jgi:hypothetical protein
MGAVARAVVGLGEIGQIAERPDDPELPERMRIPERKVRTL